QETSSCTLALINTIKKSRKVKWVLEVDPSEGETAYDARRIEKVNIHHTFHENFVTVFTRYLLKRLPM
ncbi:hypothetical protein ACAG01_25100, partial [Escherichia coli]